MTLVPLKAPDSKIPRVLAIAESDSSGAAGIQADVKTVLALGGYATTAISCVTAQDTRKTISSYSLPPSLVAAQMRASIEQIGIDSIKIGFLENESTVNAVADVLDQYKDKNIPIVIDPSIIARNGEELVDFSTIAAWKRRLYIHTKIFTPNFKEAELLGGMKIVDIGDMRHTADMMRTLGVENVVLKAGRVEIDKELYFIASPAGERIYERPTIDTKHTLGAGSTFSTALAVSMAKNMDIFGAVEHALDFLHQAMLHSEGFGRREGPVNHGFDVQTRPSLFHPEQIKVYKVAGESL